MSFLSLDSLFRSSTRGESSDDEEASAVTNISFWATTHDIENGYQDIVLGCPPGTLSGIYHRDHEGEEGSFSGTTIVSASPTSNSNIPTQVQETHVGTPWALSPSPQFQVENALSITTTESVYRNWQSLENSVNDYTLSSVDLSIFDNISSAPTLHSSNDQVDGISFRNVADRLALLPQSGEWFSRFTEQDWMQFQEVATMILNALLLESHGATLSSEVPAAFLCGFCHDIIVGAAALSCGCTVCAKCWESEDWDDCPSCGCAVEAAVPCPTLDVAIAHATHAYNARECKRRDLLLAELIQQEEEHFFKSKSTCKSTLLLVGEYALYVALASLSAVGMSVLSRRG